MEKVNLPKLLHEYAAKRNEKDAIKEQKRIEKATKIVLKKVLKKIKSSAKKGNEYQLFNDERLTKGLVDNNYDRAEVIGKVIHELKLLGFLPTVMDYSFEVSW